ncbi:sugar-transfer associated ATP-grasp domain-containing protein [Dongia deserti]|uniref:sugar-transfer associated ATP-grasp domain-containing protein n=1 Tax=Dongia deserti TaxID=2268030 RepID=UPI0013C52418|nr:sugar-transfer associated ATP-grasp domain-containing protein [Dongia deserti]
MGRAGAPKFVDSQRSVLIFLSVTTLIALYTILRPGPANISLLNLLTGVVAAATAFMACVRLALGTPNLAARRTWQAALALSGLVCVSQLAAPFDQRISTYLAIGGAGVGLLVGILALLWLIVRFDLVPAATRRVLWLAFAVQVAGTAAPLLSERPGLLEDQAGWVVAGDFLALISMQLYLLGTVLLVASVRRELFVVQRRASDVGDYARYLYATSRLFKKVRHPRIGNYTVPGHKLAFVLVRLLTWFPLIAPRVRDKFGVGMWRQFRELCIVAIRHGLDAQVYYMFELYRSEYRARTSGYLTRYEMKNGLYKVLTWQVPKTKRRIMLGDKLGMYRICEENGIPTIPILIIAEDGQLQNRCEHPAGLEQDLFIKPRQLKGSRGTEVIRYSGGKFTTESGATLDHEGLAEFIARLSKREPILVQPLIKNHAGLADLADQALMRIRVITCLDDAGKPVITHAVLSNLCKLETNWPTDIEFGAAIDLETGALGMMTGDKADMWLEWSEDHPITRARVLGRVVPCWNEVQSIALAAHSACADRLLVGWDIAVGTNGALLLEGNSYPDVDFLQRAHQCAIGDSSLGPLLFSRLVELEHRSASGTLRGPLDYD